MSRRRAPMALRTPISRVRSVTETSMMFITPMPPTSSPMELSTTITSVTMAVTERNCSTNCVRRGDEKIVRRVERNVALHAQHGAHFVDRRGKLSFPGLHDQHVFLRRGKQLVHGEIRKQNAAVVLAGKGRGGTLHHADHCDFGAGRPRFSFRWGLRDRTGRCKRPRRSRPQAGDAGPRYR